MRDSAGQACGCGKIHFDHTRVDEPMVCPDCLRGGPGVGCVPAETSQFPVEWSLPAPGSDEALAEMRR